MCVDRRTGDRRTASTTRTTRQRRSLNDFDFVVEGLLETHPELIVVEE
jgi:hypothetical protein